MKQFIALVLLAACTARAQIQYIDLSTPKTNAVGSSGFTISILGAGITNQPYSITNPANITSGDTIVAGFGKVNTNFYQLDARVNTVSNDLAQFKATNLVIWPSNTWNLAAVTNAMPNFSFKLANSNGQELVRLYLSNGVPYIKNVP